MFPVRTAIKAVSPYLLGVLIVLDRINFNNFNIALTRHQNINGVYRSQLDFLLANFLNRLVNILRRFMSLGKVLHYAMPWSNRLKLKFDTISGLISTTFCSSCKLPVRIDVIIGGKLRSPLTIIEPKVSWNKRSIETKAQCFHYSFSLFTGLQDTIISILWHPGAVNRNVQ